MNRVMNPETGELIEIGGDEYNKLCKEYGDGCREALEYNSNVKHKHQQVKVYNSVDECYIMVDEGMVEILSMIWKQECETSNSCQDNDGNIWIKFTQLSHFKSLVKQIYTLNLTKRNSSNYDTLFDFLQDKCKITVNIDDDGYIEDDTYVSGPNVLFSVSLRFDITLKDKFIELWKQIFD